MQNILKKDNNRRKSLLITLIIATVVICLAGFWANRAFYQDDAYITLKYCQNFLDGNGIVWQAGERVEGYSNFLFLILVSFLGRLGVNLVLASRAIGVAFFVALVAFMAAYMRNFRSQEETQTERIIRFLPVFLVATNLPLIVWSLGGMEGTLFTFLCTVGMGCIVKAVSSDKKEKNIAIGAVAFSFASITHPDGILFAFISFMFLGYLWRKKSIAKKQWMLFPVIFTILFVPYYVWRLLYYGDIFPNTFYVKAGSLDWSRVLCGLKYIGSFFVAPPFILIMLLFLVRHAFRSKKMDEKKIYLLVIIIAYFAYLLYVGGDWMMGYRFIIPIIPAVFLLSFLIVKDIDQQLIAPQILRISGVLVALVLCQFIDPRTNVRKTDPAVYVGTLAAKHIAEFWPEGSLIALSTAGSTPYLAPNFRYIDMLGLNDTHIGKRKIPKKKTLEWQFRPGHAKGDGAYVLSREPDYIIVGPATGTAINEPWFLSDLEMGHDARFENYAERHVRLDTHKMFGPEVKHLDFRRYVDFVYYEKVKTLPKRKVFLLAVDGLSWEIIEKHFEKYEDDLWYSELENLNFIMDRGASGVLESTFPTASPAIWTTIATGKPRAEHGITWFQLRSEDGSLTPVTSRNRKVKAIWNILSELDKKVGSVGYYATWPVEEVNGIMISDRTFFPKALGVYPEEKSYVINDYLYRYFSNDIDAENVDELSNDFENIFSTVPSKSKKFLNNHIIEFTPYFFETIKEFCSDLIPGFQALIEQPKYRDLEPARQLRLFVDDYPFIGTMLEYKFLDSFRYDLTSQLNDGNYDFFTLYISGVDVVSHNSWKYHETSDDFPVSESEIDNFKDIIPGYYRYVDEIVGTLIDQMDTDTILMIVSDHGFKKERKLLLFDVNNMLNRMGYLDYDEEGQAKNDKLYDGTFYWLGFVLYREIIVDLNGVTPFMSDVEDSAAVEKIMAELRDIRVGDIPFFDLVMLKGPVAGSKRKFVLRAKIDNIFFTPEYVMSHLNLHEKVWIKGKEYSQEEFFSFSKSSGTHIKEGVFMAYGGEIKRGPMANNISILDITPTILKLMDLPVADDMPGKAVLPIFQKNFKQALSKDTVRTYETDKKVEIEPVVTDVNDEGLKERLRSLGYIQ